MPVPPQGSTVINLSAPITVSTTVSDVTYNVVSPIGGAAITLTSTGKLVRVVVKVNELADDGVAGGGVGSVQDVAVYDAKYAGFINVESYSGANYGQHNYVDFYLSGSGVSVAPDAMLKSYDTANFGIYCEHLYNSHLDGALVALNGGMTNRNASATGIAVWNDCQHNSFNVVIGNAMPGYALQIGGGSAYNTFHDVYGDDSGAFDSDPGISFESGAHDNTITNATMKSYIVGAMLGEDVNPEVYNNRIDTLAVSNAAYAGVEMDRGAYNNTVGDVGGVTLTNCGGSSTSYPGAVSIANRSGQTNTPPHGNQVLGLNQSGTTRIPADAVYLGTGTTGNTVAGTATSWTLSELVDLGFSNSLSLR
jgi:hypothetical protein